MKINLKQTLIYIGAFIVCMVLANCNTLNSAGRKENQNNKIHVEEIIKILKDGTKKEKEDLDKYYSAYYPEHYKDLIKAVLDNVKNDAQLMKTYLSGLEPLIKYWLYASLTDGFTKDIIFPYGDWLNFEWIGCLVVHKEGDDFTLSELKIPSAQYLKYIRTLDVDMDGKDEIILYAQAHRSSTLFIYKWENGAFKEFFKVGIGESGLYEFFCQDDKKVYSIRCNIEYDTYKEREAIFELKNGEYIQTK
ncbi:MAG: hypothetical protein HY811_06315 [Planctomycetes bacterium]|nr:hypothetical protein [Planctomycetota bacterium]